ncbi:MAG: hypothetical protein Q9162_004800 [Coniocarpon cinnabarinum]
MAEDQIMEDNPVAQPTARPHRSSILYSSDEEATPSSSHFTSPTRRSHQRRSVLSRPSKPRKIITPTSPLNGSAASNNLPSAPASPPTPAPSPSPHHRLPDWSSATENDEEGSRMLRYVFTEASELQKRRLLTEMLNLCNNRHLTFVHDIVCPRLKKDPFTTLPDEICLRILSFVDEARTLGRAAQVSHRWHELVSDDITWKQMFDKYAYRRMSNESDTEMDPTGRATSPNASDAPRPPFASRTLSQRLFPRAPAGALPGASTSEPDLPLAKWDGSPNMSNRSAKRPATKFPSYRTHFKRRYMVETAWRTGGRMHARHITPDQGVVTSLHLTSKYIVVALDNAKIHVFDANGAHQKTLHGHVMGVWAMVPWGDILVSGGCDRDVRVWNMATGQNIHVLRGHTSTVRCLKMSSPTTAITGSRDTSLRVWDITKGKVVHVLVGHQASVRCIEVHGDLVASGSYDTTARIWSISEGRCLRVLQGHFSQIYAIAFDGKRVATGSLDTSVRIWDPKEGKCLAVLQGHTSLVGQLQMRDNTLVTGGSDGSVRVWTLDRMVPIHRLAAHDNSVTSLQFNEARIVSGGSDGRVKVWDLRTGQLVRELSQPAEAVWRVVFEEEKAVIMANRNARTIMEVSNSPVMPRSMPNADRLQVWSFAPTEDVLTERSRSSSGSSLAARTEHDARYRMDGDSNDVVMSDDSGERSSSVSSRHKVFEKT